MEIKQINIYPIKSLDPIAVDQVEITEGKTLEFDRRWGIFRKSDGRTVNGKKYPAVHQLRAKFDLNTKSIELRSEATTQFFSLEDDIHILNQFLSDYFEESVEVKENPQTGFPDHSGGNVGASLISDKTIQWTSQLYDLPEEEVIRRMRMNLIISTERAFEEDEWIGIDKEHPKGIFSNSIRLNAYKPCERCPVPTRNSYTSEVMRGFQKIFVQERTKLQPQLLDHPLYAHAYMCGIVLNIPEESIGKILKTGDQITL
ncbi:MOSC domain-containing protein [Flammeovirga sp. MY04]|uniref:MOSC domain-containing protein n=1 Tax=Flammeovirga sp. MY04 TaxID=1191459 RepID=UPI0008060E90|nr:MOSC N-terminal beta barrel domain-containing protein [Flammeovirga sp. MY04]ANQ48014.1 MOSC domain-containing protein [Flammeovirga sp. MY04]